MLSRKVRLTSTNTTDIGVKVMGLRTAAHRGILLALLFCLSALSARAADKKESLRISSGDLLHVSVFREPDLEQHVRVRDSGEIDLDLVGAVSVVGLVPGEAALKIAQAYEQGKYLNHPQVSVLIEEYATQQVSVLGQVAHPGAVPLMTSRSLLDVLSL